MNKQDSNNTNDHDPILGSQEWPIDLTNDDDLFSDDSSFIICTDDVLFTDDVSWFSVDADDSDDEDSDDDTDTKDSDAIHSFGDDDKMPRLHRKNEKWQPPKAIGLIKNVSRSSKNYASRN